RAVQYAVDKFAGKRITKVLTAAVDGIPLSTLLAHRLGVKLVIAKKEREVGVREFLEEMYILPGSGVTVSLYVPRGIIRKNDSVLIVDDVIDSGEAQSALIKIVERARGDVTGIFALISIGDDWKKLAQQGQYQVETILNIQPKGRET
ncbi:MAG: phosphoribosyltransferase family protein, partial [Candidatus Bathyarchaeia archaeon]